MRKSAPPTKLSPKKQTYAGSENVPVTPGRDRSNVPTTGADDQTHYLRGTDNPEALLSPEATQRFYDQYNKAAASGKLSDPAIRERAYAYARKYGLRLPTYTSKRMADYLATAQQQARDAAQPAPVDPTMAAIGSTLAPGAFLMSRVTGDPTMANLFGDYLPGPGGAFGTGVQESVLPGAAAATTAALLPEATNPYLAGAAAIAAGLQASIGQQEVQKYLLGPDLYQQYEQGRAQGAGQYPLYEAAGGILGSAGGTAGITRQVQNPMVPLNAARAYLGAGNARGALSPEATQVGKSALASLLAGGGLGFGLNVAQNVIQGQPVNWPVAAMQGLGGILQGAITPYDGHLTPGTPDTPPIEEAMAQGRNVLVYPQGETAGPGIPTGRPYVQPAVIPPSEDVALPFKDIAGAASPPNYERPFTAVQAKGSTGPMGAYYPPLASSNAIERTITPQVTEANPAVAYDRLNPQPAAPPTAFDMSGLVSPPHQPTGTGEVAPAQLRGLTTGGGVSGDTTSRVTPGRQSAPQQEGEANATGQVMPEQEGGVEQHPSGNGRRKAPKAGGGNRSQRTTQGVSEPVVGEGQAAGEGQVQPIPFTVTEEPDKGTYRATRKLPDGTTQVVFSNAGKYRLSNLKNGKATPVDYDTREEALAAAGAQHPYEATPTAPAPAVPTTPETTPATAPATAMEPAAKTFEPGSTYINRNDGTRIKIVGTDGNNVTYQEYTGKGNRLSPMVSSSPRGVIEANYRTAGESPVVTTVPRDPEPGTYWRGKNGEGRITIEGRGTGADGKAYVQFRKGNSKEVQTTPWLEFRQAYEPVAKGRTPAAKSPTIESTSPPPPPNAPKVSPGRRAAPAAQELTAGGIGHPEFDAETKKFADIFKKPTAKRNYGDAANSLNNRNALLISMNEDMMNQMGQGLSDQEKKILGKQARGVVLRVKSNPGNDKIAAESVAFFMQKGVPQKQAEMYVKGVRKAAEDAQLYDTASGSLDLFGMGHLTKKFGGFNRNSEVADWWVKNKGALPKLESGMDPAVRPLDALDKFRLPTSQVSRVPSKDGLSQTVRQGWLERNWGEKGRQVSEAITEAQRNIDMMRLNGKRQLDKVEAFVRGHAAENALTGKKADAALNDFVDLIEKPKTDPDRVNAHPLLRQALETYDNYTEATRQNLIKFQREVLGKAVPDNWGITEGGYFRHLFLNDFHIEAVNPKTGVAEKINAENYVDMLSKARELEGEGYRDFKFFGRDKPVTDPTMRIGDARFNRVLAETMKHVGKDPVTGKWILDPKAVAEDYHDAIVSTVAGRKASTVKFLGALLQRSGEANYLKDFRTAMDRYNAEVANGIEITKLRKKIEPILNEMEASDKGGVDAVRRRILLMGGSPTEADMEFANLLGRLPTGTDTTLSMTGNPLRALRAWSAGAAQAVNYIALKSRPYASAINGSGLLQQLLPRVGTKAFTEAALEYANPATRERLRQIGVLDATTKLIRDPSDKSKAIAVLVRKPLTKNPFAVPGQWFENVSAMNRAIGYLYGEAAAKRAGLGAEAQHQEGLTWAHIAEFNQGAAHAPAVMQGSANKLLFQFQGYTLNNLADWSDAIRQSLPRGDFLPRAIRGETRNLSPREARLQLARKTGTQLALGGARSFLPPLIGSGTYFLLHDYLHKSLGWDKKIAEPIARAAVYGLPSLAGFDASGSVGIMPDMVGDLSAWQMIPGASLAARFGRGAYRSVATARTPGEAAETLANTLPVGKEGYALYSLVTGKPIYFAMRQGRTGALTNWWDKAIQASGGTAFNRTLQHGLTEEKMNRKQVTNFGLPRP